MTIPHLRELFGTLQPSFNMYYPRNENGLESK